MLFGEQQTPEFKAGIKQVGVEEKIPDYVFKAWKDLIDKGDEITKNVTNLNELTYKWSQLYEYNK